MRRLLFLIFFVSLAWGDPPEVVVFDYGGVVAHVDRRPMLDFLSRSLGVSYKKVKKDFGSDKLYKAFNEPLDFWEDYGKHAVDRDWESRFMATQQKIVQPIAGMAKLIRDLKEQGFKVVLLSNTKLHRARFIERNGGYDLFDPILLSCHLGVKKPNAKIYELMLRSIRVDASKCLLIDNKSGNVAAALEMGIDAIHFKSMENLRTELASRNLVVN